MTREEVIRIATGLRTDFKCESDTMVDFCNTIIKLLNQESCDDEYIKVPKKALKYRTAGMVAYNVAFRSEIWDDTNY